MISRSVKMCKDSKGLTVSIRRLIWCKSARTLPRATQVLALIGLALFSHRANNRNGVLCSRRRLRTSHTLWNPSSSLSFWQRLMSRKWSKQLWRRRCRMSSKCREKLNYWSSQRDLGALNATSMPWAPNLNSEYRIQSTRGGLNRLLRNTKLNHRARLEQLMPSDSRRHPSLERSRNRRKSEKATNAT